jgi:hypothetical protein
MTASRRGIRPPGPRPAAYSHIPEFTTILPRDRTKSCAASNRNGSLRRSILARTAWRIRLNHRSRSHREEIPCRDPKIRVPTPFWSTFLVFLIINVPVPFAFEFPGGTGIPKKTFAAFGRRDCQNDIVGKDRTPYLDHRDRSKPLTAETCILNRRLQVRANDNRTAVSLNAKQRCITN